jgi:hypothetical protein
MSGQGYSHAGRSWLHMHVEVGGFSSASICRTSYGLQTEPPKAFDSFGSAHPRQKVQKVEFHIVLCLRFPEAGDVEPSGAALL